MVVRSSPKAPRCRRGKLSKPRAMCFLGAQEDPGPVFGLQAGPCELSAPFKGRFEPGVARNSGRRTYGSCPSGRNSGPRLVAQRLGSFRSAFSLREAQDPRDLFQDLQTRHGKLSVDLLQALSHSLFQGPKGCLWLKKRPPFESRWQECLQLDPTKRCNAASRTAGFICALCFLRPG